MPTQRRAWRHVGWALAALALVIVGGSLGFWALGSTPLDAVYRSVTTVTTVGFTGTEPADRAEKLFTIFLVLAGVGTALYALSVVLEVLVEGQLAAAFGRRVMGRRIANMSGHVIVCGWGRVGRVIAEQLAARHRDFVVVDVDPERLADVGYPSVAGDATDDAVLESIGIRRAAALVAATSNDAANLSVALSGRSLNPELFIVARARVASSEEKFIRAGADRVVNPQVIGGSRIAAMILQPHVAEFLDVVTHEAGLEFRLEEIRVPPNSPLAGRTLGDSHIRSATGALILALRHPDGKFVTNPAPETTLTEVVLIAVGTPEQLTRLTELVG